MRQGRLSHKRKVKMFQDYFDFERGPRLEGGRRMSRRNTKHFERQGEITFSPQPTDKIAGGNFYLESE
ncbi:MAG: hypothetical protein LBO77_07095 [Desulfovibrio sp.]|jgi:hypothetical protein|nr:hypothetical protein [Desulfovibrio sp.]